MHHWQSADLELMGSALAAARAGQPTALVVDGHPGVGKTSWLDELCRRATDFTVLQGEGVQGAAATYRLLEQLGAPVPTPGGSSPEPFVAAQRLRELVDAAGEGAAGVILRVDDLQWADAESTEALTWLVERALGDRLLLAVAERPFVGTHQGYWQRWASSSPRVRAHRLSGLSLAAAQELVLDRRPELTAGDAERLWRHTDGNPLYLQALLAERSAADLRSQTLLPAPAEYARDVRDRLTSARPSSVELAEAIAVIGSGWTSIADAASVAAIEQVEQVEPVDVGVTQLVDLGLVELSSAPGPAQVRWVHALTRAAVYDQLPLSRRRTLHQRAAGTLSGQAAFEHRVAAADRYDDALADDLDRASHDLEARRSYRMAGQYLHWSSLLTSDPSRRQDRWLGSLYASVLARDFDAVRTQMPELLGVDEARRSLVLGALASMAGRHRDGIAQLSVFDALPLDATDPLSRYRAEALLAWSRTVVGADLNLIAAGVARAKSLQLQDPSVERQLLLAVGEVVGRRSGREAVAQWSAALPSSPVQVPDQMAGLLVWRGGDRLARADVSGAVLDLREVQHRHQDGVVDVLHSAFDAMLATAYWFQGRWDLSSLTFRRALDVPPEAVGLFTHALASLPASGSGDWDTADRLLEQGAQALDDQPWLMALEGHVAARVVRAHAAGDRREQARLLGRARRRWPQAELGHGYNTGIWSAHLALAHVWAEEFQDAEHQLERTLAASPHTEDLELMVGWVRGLLLSANGLDTLALEQLERASEESAGELPLYRAHALGDLARIARAAGQDGRAESATTKARGIYTSLGATPYLALLFDRVAPREPQSDGGAEYVLPLTDRERDIVTLVVEGYSYAQISRELYISQSTVSYHLGNIYPKAGVRSRHELTDWIRHHPRALSSANV